MNCFQKQKGKTKGYCLSFLSVLFFLFALFLLVKEVQVVSEKNRDRQKKILEDAINHSIVQCYALEGRYPESTGYLEKNYGITYDKDKFFIDYEIIGANIMPEVTVIEKK